MRPTSPAEYHLIRATLWAARLVARMTPRWFGRLIGIFIAWGIMVAISYPSDLIAPVLVASPIALGAWDLYRYATRPGCRCHTPELALDNYQGEIIGRYCPECFQVTFLGEEWLNTGIAHPPLKRTPVEVQTPRSQATTYADVDAEGHRYITILPNEALLPVAGIVPVLIADHDGVRTYRLDKGAQPGQAEEAAYAERDAARRDQEKRAPLAPGPPRAVELDELIEAVRRVS